MSEYDEDEDALVLAHQGGTAYDKLIAERIRRERLTVLQEHAVPPELFEMLRMVYHFGSQLEEILRRVDMHKLLVEYDAVEKRWTDRYLTRCYACHAVIRPDDETFSWSTGNSVCASCETARQRSPSRPPQHGLRSALQRARRAHLPATLTEEEWRRTVDHFDDRCAYCGGSWSIVEHATPVDLGGGTTAANCLPACDSCNSAKQGQILEALSPRPTYRGTTQVQFSNERLDCAKAWLQSCGRESPIE